MAITWENGITSQWGPGIAYPVGSRVVNPPAAGMALNVYQATQGGVSDLYGAGPIGTTLNTPITDGSVTWTFLGAFTGGVVDVAPELAGEAGSAVFLALAEDMCADPCVWGSILDDGRRYLAAHFGQLARLRGKGMITAESVGPFSRSYVALNGTSLSMDLTSAGRVYETLARSTSAVFGSS